MRRLALGGLRGRALTIAAPQTHALRRQKIKTDQSDHRIAHAFELVRPGIDLQPCRVESDQQDADEEDRRQRLQCGGDEGDHDAAPHRLLIGDDVRGDDGLAMPGADRVHHAIEKAQPCKGEHGANGIAAFQSLDAGRQLPLHALLRIGDPAQQLAERTARLKRCGCLWRESRRCRALHRNAERRCRLRLGARRHRSRDQQRKSEHNHG